MNKKLLIAMLVLCVVCLVMSLAALWVAISFQNSPEMVNARAVLEAADKRILADAIKQEAMGK